MAVKKTRIIWLHSHFLYWMGGTKYVFEVARQLSRKGYQVEVVVENASEFAVKQYAKAKIPLHTAGQPTSTSALYWLMLPYFIYRHVAYVKKNFKLDSRQQTILISSMFPMNVVTTLLKLPRLQLCYEPFAFFYDRSFTAHFSIVKRTFIEFIKLYAVPLDMWGIRHQSSIVTLNSTTHQTIRETYGVLANPIYAGVNSTLFKPYVSARIRKRYQGKSILVHSTDYSPVKKTDQLLRLMVPICRAVPTAHLLITTTIESNKEREILQQLAESLGIAEHVEFLGFVPIKELPQYYSLATFFVQVASSAKSGTTSMALPVKEAMCCETPAIRFDVGGEDVVDGKTGYLILPDDYETLTKRAIYLLRHPSVAERMGKNARQAITKQYQWPKTADRLISYLPV